jgi:hypothetical protein
MIVVRGSVAKTGALSSIMTDSGPNILSPEGNGVKI